MIPSGNRNAAAALCLLVASLLGGCGFSDTLTSRGFIEEGDRICIDTLVRAGVGLSSRPDVSGAEFLGTLGSAYGAAATRFRRLEIRSDDEAMRDRVVAAYSSFAERFRAASRSAPTGAGPSQGRGLFPDVSAQQRAMKGYGFQACGGGGGSTPR